MAVILHIADGEAWAAAQRAGVYRPPSVDSEGFIHCSTLAQTLGSANLFFRGVAGLVLLRIDESKLQAECHYEAPVGEPADERSAERFPHVYGALNLDAVVQTLPFPCGRDGSFTLPVGIAGL